MLWCARGKEMGLPSLLYTSLPCPNIDVWLELGQLCHINALLRYDKIEGSE